MNNSDHAILINVLAAILGLLFSTALAEILIRLLAALYPVALVRQHTPIAIYLIFTLCVADWFLARRYSLTFEPARFCRWAKLVGWSWLLSLPTSILLGTFVMGDLGGHLLVGVLIIEWCLLALSIPVGTWLAVRYPGQRRMILGHVLYLTVLFFIPVFPFFFIISIGPI
jgi:hypothetical protein